MTLEELLARLDNVRPGGSGFIARCPAHDDRKPSLSINQEPGHILIHCHAGCASQDILDRLGLTFADLSDKGNGHQVSKSHEPVSGVLTMPGSGQGSGNADALAWYADYCRVPRDFLDTLPLQAHGERLTFTFGHAVSRKVRPTGQKQFFWEPEGALRPPLWPTPAPRLPESIYFAEGESDAVVLRYVGLEAFAVTKGASGVLTEEQARALVSRGVERVRLVFDADKAGRDGAMKNAAVLHQVGLKVEVLDLASCGLVDPLEGGKDLRDAWRGVKDAGRLCALLEESRPVEIHHLHPPTGGNGDEAQSTPIDLAGVPEPEPKQYVIAGMLPKDYVTNLYADSGQGKSYLAMLMSFNIVTGTPFLGHEVSEGSVLYLDWELDSGMQRIRWGEVARGHGLELPPPGLMYRRMTKSLLASLGDIQSWLHELRPALVVVDSVGKALGQDPLDHMQIIKFYSALDGKATFLCIDHQPKPGGESGYGSKWEFGSSYKRNLARSSWQLERLGADATSLSIVLRHKKSNFGPRQADINARLTFGEGAVGLEVIGGAAALPVAPSGVRARIVSNLTGQRLDVNQMAELMPDLDLGSIRNEITAMKHASLVAEVGRNGRAPVYALSHEIHHEPKPMLGEGDEQIGSTMEQLLIAV